MSRFQDKVVVISGGSRGMGASHARGFHDEGAFVVVGDVLHAEGKAVVDALGSRALFVPLDVTEPESWTAAITATEEAFGSVSVLVNNAAVIEDTQMMIESSDPESWRRVGDINLFGQYLGIRAVIPSMRKAGGGAIVNISSVGGFMATPGHSAYCASKWAVRGLTKAAALELGRDNIRVNSVHPGITDTPMHAKTQSPVGGKKNPNAHEQFAISRMADPSEMTRMVMFVASDDASFSTGAEFIADGGFLLGTAVARDVS